VLFIRNFPENGATLSTVVMTVAVLIFGEITPKSLAKDLADPMAMLIAPIM
jgi:Mg2+/Co2+ transporter CorB